MKGRRDNPEQHAQDWLARLLAGDFAPTGDDLDAFVSICGDAEGLHHELKPGNDPSSGTGAEPSQVLRKYVAGFANSDSGFVLLGYSQKERGFDGFTAPGGGRLVDWAARGLRPIAGYLSPPPRIIAAPAGREPNEVLIVAVQRAPAFVPVIQGNRPVFYFRIGDSTIEMPPYNTIGVPDYLIADVLLGRRQRPWLTPLRPELTIDMRPLRSLGGNVHAHEATIDISLENQSLVYAEAVTAGIVSWSLDLDRLPKEPPRKRASTGITFPPDLSSPVAVPSYAFDMIRRKPTRVPHSLDGYLDLIEPEHNSRERWSDPWEAMHAPAWRGPLDLHLPPFSLTELTFGPLALPVFDCHDSEENPPKDERARHQWALRRGYMRLVAALYVVAKASPPQWFSLGLVYGEGSLPRSAEELRKPSRCVVAELSANADPRTRVAMEVEEGHIRWAP